jgi:glycosyltransferase involved in cell wall biosynthesis
MHRAGLETMLMNYYRNIDRTKIQFDFLTHRPNRSDYDDEIESLGGKVYYAPRLYPQNYPAYFKWMKQFFIEHPEYQIMHSHIDSMSYLPLLAGKKAGVPIRIAHSHNTAIDKDFKYILKQYFRHRITSAANMYLACGEEAGQFLFGNKEFTVIPNAVDAEKFYFDQNLRERKRKELGLADEFVIGHVGRISYQKNHKFLIEIFSEVLKQEAKAVLLLIGVGEKEEEVREQIRKLGIDQKVRFLGNRSDVHELYQAMDVFLLPSLFEGIPVVGVEAQFADLPCFFSDKVPKEVKFNNKSQFIELNMSSKEWADRILKVKHCKRSSNGKDIINSHYDIKVAHDVLEDYYDNLINNKKYLEGKNG